MATLVKEDGTGKATANSYASLADGNAYQGDQLYSSVWDSSSDGNKVLALIMSTRLIDAEYQFNGVKATATQALAWPREDCPDPDSDAPVASNVVPAAVVKATCELAKEFLTNDRTEAPVGEGLKYLNTSGTSGSQVGYDKADRRPIICVVAQAMLSKFGSMFSARGGAVRLVRT